MVRGWYGQLIDEDQITLAASDHGRKSAVVKLKHGPWDVHVLIVHQGTQPVVAGVNIFPRDIADLPDGGLTTRKLRSLRLEQVFVEAQRRVRKGSKATKAMGQFVRQDRKNHGRPAIRTDQQYVEMAVAYVAACEQTHQPYRILMKQFRQMNRSQLANFVADCVRKGWLERSPGPGKAGGKLTKQTNEWRQRSGGTAASHPPPAR
jgi:hypothetical protein